MPARVGSRFVSVLLGLGAIAVPVAASHAQVPATQPTADEPTTNPYLQPKPLANPFSPADSPANVSGELQSTEPVSGAIFDWGIEDVFPKSVNDGRAELKEKYGFEIGFAYTALYQQASGGPGERNAAGGDLDLFGTWRLIGTEDHNPGTLVYCVKNNET